MNTIKLCGCGCGAQVTSPTASFLRGHPSRLRGRTADGKRVCPDCKQAKPETAEFFRRCRSRASGFSGLCKTCHDKKVKEYGIANPDKLRKRNREYVRRRREKDPEKYKAIRRRYYNRLRGEMLAAYGGKCSCCGVSNPEFLTIEHKKRDGHLHRKQLKSGGGAAVWLDLKRRGWPQEDYTVLCWNCNLATRFGEVCPHRSAVTLKVPT